MAMIKNEQKIAFCVLVAFGISISFLVLSVINGPFYFVILWFFSMVFNALAFVANIGDDNNEQR